MHRGDRAKLGEVVGIDHVKPHQGCVDCPYNHRCGIVVEKGEWTLTLRMLSPGNLLSAHVIVAARAVHTSHHVLSHIGPDAAHAYSVMLEMEVGKPPYRPDRTAMPATPQMFNLFEHRTCLRCGQWCADDTSFLLVNPLYHSPKAVCNRCLEPTPPGRCVVCFVSSKSDPKGVRSYTSEALLQHAREVQCASCTGCGRSMCIDCMADQLPFCLMYGVLPQIQRCVPKFTCGHCDRPHDLTLQPLTALEEAHSFLNQTGLGYDSELDDSDSDSDSDVELIVTLIRFLPESVDVEDQTLSFQTATGDVSMTRAKFQRLLRTAELV